MRAMMHILAGVAGGGGLGYGLADALDPLIPLMLFGAATLLFGGALLLAMERDADRG